MSDLAYDYWREKGQVVIANSHGFISASILGEACLIQDLYAAPKYRKTLVAGRLVYRMIDIARSRGCRYLCAEIYRSDPLFDYNLNIHKKFGMAVVEETPFPVLTSKKI